MLPKNHLSYGSALIKCVRKDMHIDRLRHTASKMLALPDPKLDIFKFGSLSSDRRFALTTCTQVVLFIINIIN
ncbi:MAG: hypothetical protein WBA07_25995 [Rivularia sp. (in: cyanobacteria)]